MAIHALDEMYVVNTLGGLERRVHGFHVQAAIRELRMTRRARRPGLLAVSAMAGEAAESFVDADGRAVVARTHLPGHQRCVALVTESLTNVGTDLNFAVAVAHRRQ